MISVSNGVILEVSNKSGHYGPTQENNNQVFIELQQRGMAEKNLNKIMRSGYADDGSVMTPMSHGEFMAKNTQASKQNTSPTTYIPKYWMDE